MADENKPKRFIVVNVPTKSKTGQESHGVILPKPLPQRRPVEELRPIAERVAENAALMQRVNSAVGSGNENLVWEVMAEVKSYLKIVDPTVTDREGTRIFAILTEQKPRNPRDSK
jgi:hypothetical protein